MILGHQSLRVISTFLTKKILHSTLQLILYSIHNENLFVLFEICSKVYEVEEKHYLFKLQPLIQDITCKVEIFWQFLFTPVYRVIV